MGRDAVQEPAVVGDDHGAACEVLDTFLQGPDGVYIHIVGGLVEQEDIALVLEGQGQVETVALTSGEDTAELLLVGSREVEARDVGAGVDLTVAQADELGVLRYGLVDGLVGVYALRKRVVLPAPLGPMTPTMPAGGREKVRCSKRSLSP